MTERQYQRTAGELRAARSAQDILQRIREASRLTFPEHGIEALTYSPTGELHIIMVGLGCTSCGELEDDFNEAALGGQIPLPPARFASERA